MNRVTPARRVANLFLCAAAGAGATALPLVFALAYIGASTYTQPSRRVSSVIPTDVGLAYEEVRLVAEDSLRLAAWYVPTRSGAALVLLHGIGGNRGQLLSLGRYLAERDYGLFILDLRAHGESEGEASTLGLHEVRDVRAAVNYLLQRPEVDKSRIGIYGASLGASVAIMAAAEVPELQVVVADSGFASLDWLVRSQFDALLALPPWAAPLVVRIGAWQAGVDAAQISPVSQIGRISPRPVLIIHGEQDSLFLVENARLLAEAAREPKEVWLVPDVGHTGAFARDPAEYVGRVAGFFDRALDQARGRRSMAAGVPGPRRAGGQWAHQETIASRSSPSGPPSSR